MVAATKTDSPYSVHPGIAMMQKWIRELPGKTGRSLEEWIALTRKAGPLHGKGTARVVEERTQAGDEFSGMHR